MESAKSVKINSVIAEKTPDGIPYLVFDLTDDESELLYMAHLTNKDLFQQFTATGISLSIFFFRFQLYNVDKNF